VVILSHSVRLPHLHTSCEILLWLLGLTSPPAKIFQPHPHPQPNCNTTVAYQRYTACQLPYSLPAATTLASCPTACQLPYSLPTALQLANWNTAFQLEHSLLTAPQLANYYDVPTALQLANCPIACQLPRRNIHRASMINEIVSNLLN
jgi:hypothetical protein